LQRTKKVNNCRSLIGIVFILIGGCAVRLIPYIAFRGNFLGDLDPYRYLRAIGRILEQGRIPALDTAVAPIGTSATFAVNHGYYLLMSQLALLTNAELVPLLGLSPIVFFIFFGLSLYIFAYYSSECESVALMTILLVSFMPGWWGLVYYLSSNPLSENVGIALFPLILAALVCFLNCKDRRYLMLSGFMLGASFAIHPATFVWASILTLLFFLTYFYSEKSKVSFFVSLAYIAMSLFLTITPFFATMHLSDIRGFTEAASYLTSLKEQYYVLSISQLIGELGVIQIFFATLGLLMLKDQSKKRGILALAGLVFMSLLMLVSSFEILRKSLENVPASGLFILSHRMVPYLLQFVYFFASLAIIKYSSLFGRIGVRKIFVLFVAFMVGVSSFATISNSYNFALKFQVDNYNDLFKWINVNTQENEVIIANLMDLNVWIRSIVERPTVFSFSYEDLISKDMANRILLYAAVYTFQYNHSLTLDLLIKYQVKYVVVVPEYHFIDPLHGVLMSGVHSKNDISTYITKLQDRNYLTLAYSNPLSSHFIFRVDTHT